MTVRRTCCACGESAQCVAITDGQLNLIYDELPEGWAEIKMVVMTGDPELRSFYACSGHCAFSILEEEP